MSGLFRWAGGKGRIVNVLLSHIKPPRRWIEPFVGAGAVAIEAMRRRFAESYIFADINRDVVSVYDCLRTVGDSLVANLREFTHLSKEEQQQKFLELRPAYAPQFIWQNARRLYILQACSFNGVYRVNSKGVYNVPFGRKASFDLDLLTETSRLLRRYEVQLHCQDFETTIALAGPDDAIYADPPYLGTHSAYTATGFGVAEHERLARCLREAVARGATCWVSGSDCDETRRVYGSVAHTISVQRSISRKAATRGRKTELLIQVM